MINTRIAIIIVIAIIGVLMNFAVAGSPKTYASSLMQLVAVSAHEVHQLQSNITKLKSDVTKLQSQLNKTQPAATPQTNVRSGGLQGLVTVSAQDITQFQSDITKLQSEETKLQYDMTQILSEGNKTLGH